MELTVYLGTKVHEQIRKPDSQSSIVPVLDPTCAPPPQLPQVPFQPPSCHRKGWLVGEGKRQCSVYTAVERTRGKQSSATGSLKMVHLPASPGPPHFVPKGRSRDVRPREYQTGGNFKVTWENPNQSSSSHILIAYPLIPQSVKWELLLCLFCRWGD